MKKIAFIVLAAFFVASAHGLSSIQADDSETLIENVIKTSPDKDPPKAKTGKSCCSAEKKSACADKSAEKKSAACSSAEKSGCSKDSKTKESSSASKANEAKKAKPAGSCCSGAR